MKFVKIATMLRQLRDQEPADLRLPGSGGCVI